MLAPLASALFWESSPSPSAPARDGALGVVDNMINENKVTIFSNSKCTSSAKAKTVLEDMGVPYLAIELDQRLDGQSLKAVLAERTGAKSLPYVFVHGQHVGGAAETRRAYETGELSHWVDSHWPGNKARVEGRRSRSYVTTPHLLHRAVRRGTRAARAGAHRSGAPADGAPAHDGHGHGVRPGRRHALPAEALHASYRAAWRRSRS